MTKKEDSLSKVYNSDGETGHFCDMEYLEDNQDFDEYAIPDAPTPPMMSKFL